MSFMQEKFQITVPLKQQGKDGAGDGWVTPNSQMVKFPQDHLVLPTTGITSPVVERDGMPLSIAGTTDVSGAQAELSAQHKGYSLGDMGMTDDLYTGEHVDLFYGDTGGFVERNNYLDRA